MYVFHDVRHLFMTSIRVFDLRFIYLAYCVMIAKLKSKHDVLTDTESSCMMRQCCGPARGFVMHIEDNFGKVSIQLLSTSPAHDITFRMRHSRVETYFGHGRLCVCVFIYLFARQ